MSLWLFSARSLVVLVSGKNVECDIWLAKMKTVLLSETSSVLSWNGSMNWKIQWIRIMQQTYFTWCLKNWLLCFRSTSLYLFMHFQKHELCNSTEKLDSSFKTLLRCINFSVSLLNLISMLLASNNQECGYFHSQCKHTTCAFASHMVDLVANLVECCKRLFAIIAMLLGLCIYRLLSLSKFVKTSILTANSII